jgi:hypothetical protein
MKLFGYEFKEIRKDLAIHDFYLGFANLVIVNFTLLVGGMVWGIRACIFMVIVWFGFEVYQKISKKGTFSILDWFASCRTLLFLAMPMIIIYTKILNNSINQIFKL